jgi:hypothetical protein
VGRAAHGGEDAIASSVGGFVPAMVVMPCVRGQACRGRWSGPAVGDGATGAPSEPRDDMQGCRE